MTARIAIYRVRPLSVCLAVLSLLMAGVLFPRAGEGTVLPPGGMSKPRQPLITLAASKPASKPTTLQGPARFEKAIAAFEQADRISPPPPGAILFTGSSTITRWKSLQEDFPGLPVVNRGFGGSTIADVVYFTDRIFATCRPRLIVFYAGSNDINAGRTPERVLADFKTFVSKVRKRLPEVRILYMGIGPTPKRWLQADKQKQANQLIHDYCEHTPGLQYLEAWDEFLGADGKPREELYVADKQHNNADGYKIRIKLLRPYLQDAIKTADSGWKSEPERH